MPNLTLRADPDDVVRLRELLPRISELTAEVFGVSQPNVMLLEMHKSDGTARIYAEIFYLDRPDRGPERLRKYAHALADAAGCEEGRMAFRGFPVRKGEIVSLDVTLEEAE